MAEEKSKAQKEKDDRVEKVENDLRKEYEKLLKDHNKEAEKAREDQPDQAETEEEYEARIKAVKGGETDPSAFDPNATTTPEEDARKRPAVSSAQETSDGSTTANRVAARGNVPGTGEGTETQNS